MDTKAIVEFGDNSCWVLGFFCVWLHFMNGGELGDTLSPYPECELQQANFLIRDMIKMVHGSGKK